MKFSRQPLYLYVLYLPLRNLSMKNQGANPSFWKFRSYAKMETFSIMQNNESRSAYYKAAFIAL